MAARGHVNGEGPTKWEGFSFPDVTLLHFNGNDKSGHSAMDTGRAIKG